MPGVRYCSWVDGGGQLRARGPGFWRSSHLGIWGYALTKGWCCHVSGSCPSRATLRCRKRHAQHLSATGTALTSPTRPMQEGPHLHDPELQGVLHRYCRPLRVGAEPHRVGRGMRLCVPGRKPEAGLRVRDMRLRTACVSISMYRAGLVQCATQDELHAC